MRGKVLFALTSTLRRFAQGEEAVSAIFTALIVIPLIGVIGLSMDAGTLWLAHSRLSYATDAAALTGGQAYFSATRDSQINAMFAADFPAAAMGATVGTPTITTDAAQTQITVATSAQVPTVFMKMFNVNSVQMNASSTVQRLIGGLQVALVLDVTGSMGNGTGSKLYSMEQGANALLDTVFNANTTPNSVYAAVVPFRAAVNVGPSHSDWIVSTFDWTKFNKTTTSWDFSHWPWKQVTTSTHDNPAWFGCVEARALTNNLDFSDQVPSSDAYRFTPYLYPDTSKYGSNGAYGGYYFDNNWPSSLTGNTYGMNDTATGPNLNCPEQPVIPLTTDKTSLKNAINSFTTISRGGTQIVQGLAWGWRVLSDSWQSYWGVTIAPGVRTKALVLLTDGDNQVVDWPNTLPGNPLWNDNNYNNNSDYTAYGRVYTLNPDGTKGPKGPLIAGLTGTNLGPTDMEKQLDARMAAACDAIKAQGIVIYTIGYQVPTSAVAGLKKCASGDSKYLAADQTTIVNTFKTIANQLANLKIVK